MDYIVHAVTKSRTQLSDFSLSFHNLFILLCRFYVFLSYPQDKRLQEQRLLTLNSLQTLKHFRSS